jgi:pimeloyl-ACP methyl ester carboxylesterase
MGGFDVLSFDLPGHGDSRGEPETSIEGYAERIFNWLSSRNLNKVIVGGHSMGGGIALTMSMMAPERVTALVLVSTGARLRVHPKILQLTSSEEQFQRAAELVTSWSFSDSADARLRELALQRMEEVKAEVTHSDFHACNDFDLMDQLRGIRAPTLVICGEEDLMTPVKYSQYLADQISGASLHIISGAGHMVMLEKPVEVAGKIREFVQTLSTG